MKERFLEENIPKKEKLSVCFFSSSCFRLLSFSVRIEQRCSLWWKILQLTCLTHRIRFCSPTCTEAKPRAELRLKRVTFRVALRSRLSSLRLRLESEVLYRVREGRMDKQGSKREEKEATRKIRDNEELRIRKTGRKMKEEEDTRSQKKELEEEERSKKQKERSRERNNTLGKNCFSLTLLSELRTTVTPSINNSNAIASPPHSPRNANPSNSSAATATENVGSSWVHTRPKSKRNRKR